MKANSMFPKYRPYDNILNPESAITPTTFGFGDINLHNQYKSSTLGLVVDTWLNRSGCRKSKLTDETVASCIDIITKNNPSPLGSIASKAIATHHLNTVFGAKSSKPATEEQKETIYNLYLVIPVGSKAIKRVTDVKLITHNSRFYGTNMKGKITSMYMINVDGIYRIPVSHKHNYPTHLSVSRRDGLIAKL